IGRKSFGSRWAPPRARACGSRSSTRRAARGGASASSPARGRGGSPPPGWAGNPCCGAPRWSHPNGAGGVPLSHTPICGGVAKAREELRVWFDERNVLYMNGKPAFVMGLYTTGGYSNTRSTYALGQDGWGVTKMSEAPINMLINYHLGRAPIPALSTYMDELSSRGIRYLQTVNFYYRDDPQYKEIDYPAAREGEDALNRWVAKTLSSHPGLAGFYTADERPADMVPRAFA